MRIGLLSQWFEPEPGPPSIPAVLGRELIARGHDVRALTGYPNYPQGRLYDGYHLRVRADSVEGGVPVRRVALYPNHGRSSLGRLANYGSFALSATASGVTSLRGADALWVYNSPPTVGLPTWVIKARYRPRVVLHIMDMWPESLTASGFGTILERHPRVGRLLDAWLSFTYDTADAIACTSRRQIELLADRGVPRDKLSHVPVWPDEAVFHPATRDAGLAADLGVEGKFVLLYAGTLGDTQGLDALVDACAALVDEPRFHCLVAGSGVAETRLRTRAAALGLTNLSFLGQWPSTDMTRLMSVGDVHVVSLRSDPLASIAMPSKIQSILACAKPMIVAAEGEAADTALRAGAGWTCAPDDAGALALAIREALATSGDALHRIGASGRDYFDREFSVRVGVDRVESLLAGRDRGVPHAE